MLNQSQDISPRFVIEQVLYVNVVLLDVRPNVLLYATSDQKPEGKLRVLLEEVKNAIDKFPNLISVVTFVDTVSPPRTAPASTLPPPTGRASRPLPATIPQ